MKHIEKLMTKGWNITIECKAKGRINGMTFEASGIHPSSGYNKRLHAVGDSLTAVEEVLVSQAANITGLLPERRQSALCYTGAYYPIADKTLSDDKLKLMAQNWLSERLANESVQDMTFKEIEVRREVDEVYIYVTIDCDVPKHPVDTEEELKRKARNFVTDLIEQGEMVAMEVYDVTI